MMTVSPETLSLEVTDFLVIGSGIAGLRAAIALGESGRVLIVNKGRPPESASEYAQGGIAVALESEDSVEAHLDDTLQAGKGLCHPEATGLLVKEGPDRVQELIEWGARFDQHQDRFLLASEAGHRFARILRAQGDATGTEIVRVLRSKAKQIPSVRWLDQYFTADLLTEEGRCVGAVLLSASGKVSVIGARAVILATGGAGQVYSRTTNPPLATADGMAMAFRAGAVLEDMEFVQFHPTALALDQAPAFLLTEAMRGEGAILRDLSGKAFMKEYDPAGELATRDIVSRAVWHRMKATGSSHVYLDITHRDADFIRQRFPTITKTCSRYGLDMTQTPIPVSPSAHFMIGGVTTSPTGLTSIPGLYAAGEVTCSGIHGANRLASNSLLEGLVFGARAGTAARASEPHPWPDPERLHDFSRKRLPDYITDRSNFPKKLSTETQALRQLMWEEVGIVRSRETLLKAIKRLEGWNRIASEPIRSQAEGEFKNLVTTALLISRAALLRENSIGVHYRSDDPKPGNRPGPRHFAFRLPDHPDGYVA